MKLFDSLPLPTLVRYGLTGMVAVILFIVLPYVFLEPDIAIKFATPGGISVLVVGGIIVGFLLDALKVYQLSPGYKKTKQQFFNDIASVVNVQSDEAMAFSSRAVQLEKQNEGGNIFFQHSRWVMITTSGTLFSVGGICGCLSVYNFLSSKLIRNCFAVSVAGFISLVIGARLFQTAKQVRKMVNQDYLFFCKENREQNTFCRGRWRLTRET